VCPHHRGAAFCWGSDIYGAVGNGSKGFNVTSPSAVGGGIVFSSITSGAFHTCAISTAGPTYCWGDNSSGQLGDGTTTDRVSPTLVTGSLAFAGVGAGFSHTCALTAPGATYCWGSNTSGQLGNGTMTSQLSPTAVSLP
jgi:alpha-tubulin suppressor-like RCC1 family protein